MVVFYNQSKYDEKSEYRISKSETNSKSKKPIYQTEKSRNGNDL